MRACDIIHSTTSSDPEAHPHPRHHPSPPSPVHPPPSLPEPPSSPLTLSLSRPPTLTNPTSHVPKDESSLSSVIPHGMPVIRTSQVRWQLIRTRTNKARGPDDINSKVLKVCAGRLPGVLRHLFDLSLRLKKMPKIWKTSCIVPVPKKGQHSAPGDYIPVALTSHRMKTFERLVLQHLRPLTVPTMSSST